MATADSDYKNCTDGELMELLRRGEMEVMDFICDKYKNLVRSKAKSMFILGADKDDLIQEGMIGLFKAVRDYDPGRDASFATFADLCISRQMYTAIQAAQRQKHQPLNTYISLDAERSFAETEEGSEGMLFDILAESHEMTPEERVLDQERVKFLQDAIETHLSEFEKQVLDLYMTGMATAQIARVLGRDEKATGNALGRAKQKIKERIRKQA